MADWVKLNNEDVKNAINTELDLVKSGLGIGKNKANDWALPYFEAIDHTKIEDFCMEEFRNIQKQNLKTFELNSFIDLGLDEHPYIVARVNLWLTNGERLLQLVFYPDLDYGHLGYNDFKVGYNLIKEDCFESNIRQFSDSEADDIVKNYYSSLTKEAKDRAISELESKVNSMQDDLSDLRSTLEHFKSVG